MHTVRDTYAKLIHSDFYGKQRTLKFFGSGDFLKIPDSGGGSDPPRVILPSACLRSSRSGARPPGRVWAAPVWPGGHQDVLKSS